MMPQLQPTNWFSACWPLRAISAWLMSSPWASLKAWPMATSREAEEESPVPWGTLPETTRLRPRKA